ncbi:protein translocase subunit SecD [Candidatus Pantoea edessiphila]|uniref:Protein translocase subunit SecD n=1 Tax=Candidatus Pantoea edessiphila TaxID=2044610 RepID=A0A2P5SZE7_9GAMM|nr:protein translocase subunit SecD [Candidatus Pantoea edessiphila]PPI87718.1 protein translocase subunit SecD [Candidatus Pantoea edessiphila]
MLNRYPMWKYVLLSLIVIISALYAIPNLYGEDPAVQIISKNNDFNNQKIFYTIKKLLKQNNIKYKSISTKNGIITALFNNIDTQLLAHDTIAKKISKKYIVALNLVPATPNWLNVIAASPIKLGFDLRGGVQFLIEADIHNLLKKIQHQNINNIRNDLIKRNIPYTKIYSNKMYSVKINFNNFQDLNNALVYLRSIHKNLLIEINDHSLIVTINLPYINQLKKRVIEQNIAILRNRINQLGISESSVQRQGSEYILINLPGIQNIAHAKGLIGATATLEFRLVNTDINSALISKKIIPFDSEIKYMTNGQPIVLNKEVILTGDHITYSNVNIDEYSNPEVDITLDSIGGDIIASFTKNNLGKLIATLFIEYKDSGKKDSQGHAVLIKNEEVINVANIGSQLSNNFRITGIKNITNARQLSMLLRAGALVAPIHIIEERTVGPAVGKQNIVRGLKACVCGLLSCVFFMVFFYKKFGLISISALLINLIIIIGIISILPGITLTMSGIAGIVLTLAVSIDSNILINERIKEEIYNGCSIQKAINKGYKHALSSIIDSNITTLIKSIILYAFGTGFIRGFAIMTIIGILTSMFTAILITKAIVNLIYGNRNITKLSI